MKLIDIAFDLDGCLVDIMPAVEEELFIKYGVRMLPKETWDVETEPYLAYDRIKEIFHIVYQKYINEFDIMPGAIELLEKLYNESDGDPIKIVTARPWTAATPTYEFVHNRLCKNIKYELILTSRNLDKITFLHRYNYFVEDRRKNAIRISKQGKKVFLVPAKYNKLDREYENIIPLKKGVINLIPLVKTILIKEI